MPQKWPVAWSDCLSILTVLNACNASVEPSASHELHLFLICYPPNFAQNLGFRLGGLHLVGYATYTPDCDHYVTPCQPELMAPPAQEFYVIWVFSRTGELASPEEWQTGTRFSRCDLVTNSMDRMIY
jgi:hypothetical protein